MRGGGGGEVSCGVGWPWGAGTGIYRGSNNQDRDKYRSLLGWGRLGQGRSGPPDFWSIGPGKKRPVIQGP